MSMLQEFKAFAMRGNVVDLAVGVVIGAAFGTIVTSLVNDIIMPPIGRITGGVNFSDFFIALDGQHYPSLAEAKRLGAPVIAYGNFINTVINFVIIAFAIFFLVKAINRLYRPTPAAAPEPPKQSAEEKLLTEIRDLLAKQSAAR
jgi:large conductance mechanosensitive channel